MTLPAPMSDAQEFWMITALHNRMPPAMPPPRRRVLWIAGRPREVRGDRDLVRALADALVELATGAAGAASEADLVLAGFTRAELDAWLPDARARAAAALRDKAV